MRGNIGTRLSNSLASILGETVSYSDGSHSVDWSCTPTSTQRQLVDGSGNLIEWESFDFVGLASEIVLDGSVVIPKRGHRITRTLGETTEVYEVHSPGTEQHFRYSLPDKSIVRIHTKLIGTT